MKTQNLFSAVLDMRYVCTELSSDIIITGVSGNQAQGIFTMDKFSIPITVYRHIESPKTKGATNIWFAGADVNPNEFVGGVGRYAAPARDSGLPGSIFLGGAYPFEDAVITFSGTYLRMD